MPQATVKAHKALLRRVAGLLLDGYSQAQAAKAVRRSPLTLSQWQRRPEYEDVLTEAREEREAETRKIRIEIARKEMSLQLAARNRLHKVITKSRSDELAAKTSLGVRGNSPLVQVTQSNQSLSVGGGSNGELAPSLVAALTEVADRQEQGLLIEAEPVAVELGDGNKAAITVPSQEEPLVGAGPKRNWVTSEVEADIASEVLGNNGNRR